MPNHKEKKRRMEERSRAHPRMQMHLLRSGPNLADRLGMQIEPNPLLEKTKNSIRDIREPTSKTTETVGMHEANHARQRIAVEDGTQASNHFYSAMKTRFCLENLFPSAKASISTSMDDGRESLSRLERPINA
jgi:hypothetical protein